MQIERWGVRCDDGDADVSLQVSRSTRDARRYDADSFRLGVDGDRRA
jgi:hypothetical protein